MERRVWMLKQDEELKRLVAKLGEKSWADIATMMSRKFNNVVRSGKQCRDRYLNHLAPQINLSKIDETEVHDFNLYRQKHHNSWTHIAKDLFNHTENQIKNFYYSSLRKALRIINGYLVGRGETKILKEQFFRRLDYGQEATKDERVRMMDAILLLGLRHKPTESCTDEVKGCLQSYQEYLLHSRDKQPDQLGDSQRKKGKLSSEFLKEEKANIQKEEVDQRINKMLRTKKTGSRERGCDQGQDRQLDESARQKGAKLSVSEFLKKEKEEKEEREEKRNTEKEEVEVEVDQKLEKILGIKKTNSINNKPGLGCEMYKKMTSMQHQGCKREENSSIGGQNISSLNNLSSFAGVKPPEYEGNQILQLSRFGTN